MDLYQAAKAYPQPVRHLLPFHSSAALDGTEHTLLNQHRALYWLQKEAEVCDMSLLTVWQVRHPHGRITANVCSSDYERRAIAPNGNILVAGSGLCKGPNRRIQRLRSGMVSTSRPASASLGAPSRQ